MSHPTGVRGLKLAEPLRLLLTHLVAPHWGAWIEIPINDAASQNEKSHPTGVRGLKFRHP